MKDFKDPIMDGISVIDEIFRNKGRQNIIGTLVTGIGATIAMVGVTILMNKPQYNESMLEQDLEKTE